MLQNTDASLIPAISFPAFAVKDGALRHRTFDKILRKLKGKYGFRRFLRDGYGTVLEDRNRKYYRPAEIKVRGHGLFTTISVLQPFLLFPSSLSYRQWKFIPIFHAVWSFNPHSTRSFQEYEIFYFLQTACIFTAGLHNPPKHFVSILISSPNHPTRTIELVISD